MSISRNTCTGLGAVIVVVTLPATGIMDRIHKMNRVLKTLPMLLENLIEAG